MNDDLAAVALGCVDDAEADTVERLAARDGRAADLLHHYRGIVAQLDEMIAGLRPPVRPEVWERIAQSLD